MQYNIMECHQVVQNQSRGHIVQIHLLSNHPRLLYISRGAGIGHVEGRKTAPDVSDGFMLGSSDDYPLVF